MPNNEDPQLSDFLASLREKGDGFRSPSQAHLAALSERALTEAKRPAVVRPLRRFWLGAVAAVLLLVLATTFLLPATEPAATAGPPAAAAPQYNSEALLADLETAVIEAYISDQLDEFETELYASAPLK